MRMKLLICTQAVDTNDPILGFFHGWVKEFSKHFESVIVICLKEGKHDLPSNVRVLSLGKENMKGADTMIYHSIARVIYAARFVQLIWKERKNYDSVFVHMNQEYVVLGGILWRTWNKRIALWYTHKSVTLQLRMAEKLVHTIFSASTESFRLKSKKIVVTGHGIDTGLFSCTKSRDSADLKAITVGRISRRKNLFFILGALAILKKEQGSFHFTIVGAPITKDDDEYVKELQEKIDALGLRREVVFVGAKTQPEVVEYLCRSDVFLHASKTGSVDKAVLEAMSCGVIPVTTSEAFVGIVPQELAVKEDARVFADAIQHAREYGGEVVQASVIANHGLPKLITNLVVHLQV